VTIRAEFRDTREAANAQLKLSQLRYRGDIKAYFTEFHALNVYTQATGEGLREKIDQAMPDHICNTRVFHQRHNRPGGHQQSITLERATLV